MTETERIDVVSLAEAFAKSSLELGETEERIALHVYGRLALGAPVPPGEIAAAAGTTTRRVEDLLERWPAVFRDRHGRVVGFWGLTVRELVPTHRVTVDGRTLFAWCAWDTLFLPELLGATAQVESTCPVTGERLSLTVTPDALERTSHPDAAVSFLVPREGLGEDVITTFCHFVHFFASQEAGRTWVGEHAGTFLLPLDRAFELGRAVNHLNFCRALEAAR